MKTYYFIYSLSIVFSLTFFQSCTNDEQCDSLSLVADDSKIFEDELKDFHKECLNIINVTRSRLSIDTTLVIKTMQNRLREIINRTDIYSDLDSIQLRGINLSEDFIDILELDSASLNNYLYKYKTPSFRTEMGKIQKGLARADINTIINSENFKKHEKLALVIIEEIDNIFPVTGGYVVATSDCDKAYGKAVKYCQTTFAIDIIGSMCTAEAIPITLGISVLHYITCLSYAAIDYEDCKKNESR